MYSTTFSNKILQISLILDIYLFLRDCFLCHNLYSNINIIMAIIILLSHFIFLQLSNWQLSG